MPQEEKPHFEMLPPGLYLVPTPLATGTAHQVLAPQVKEILASADWFFCEVLKTSRRLISELKLGRPIDSLIFYELNKDTGSQQLSDYIKLIAANPDKRAAMLSEAGCPGIADPGSALVSLAHKSGIPIYPLPGPNAMTLILMGSGFLGQRYSFLGYLPISAEQRQKAIKAMRLDLQNTGATQIFMETPYRNNALLRDLVNNLPGEQLLCIGADLTGQNQLLRTQTIKQWKAKLPDLHKIPAVFAIGD